MIGVIFYAIAKKKISNSLHAVIILSATFVNIAVWLAEQLVHIDFEFLSVSYIITEIFLLLVTLLMQENSLIQIAPAIIPETSVKSDDPIVPDVLDQEMVEKGKYLITQLPTLTPTEKTIYDYYVEGKAAKDILVLLDIKENTLKYHNKNIYSKLGVSSRKQMIELACFMKNLNF
jgi:DNA-binding CsgD family transcriptional regulator